MVPMAIPSFGGMLVVLLTVFTVPVLYCGVAELRLARTDRGPAADGERAARGPTG
jgi:Cu(I)/Ag(I) efflux system membrane protein CusA/SilA